MKRKGNPNWGRPMVQPIRYPANITQFEALVLRHNLSFDNQQAILETPAIRQFVRKHANTRYVPEWLLDAMGIIPHVAGGLE